ncbi:MAG: thiaminase II [Alphaproteobacteria bacterium]|nr:thiaminase II [Alphaproteobacteria bacterium]
MANAPEFELYETLKAHCGDDWTAYIQHEFVRGLGDGSLPRAAFQYYLRQDYLFLINFARAHALAAFQAETLEDLRQSAKTVSAILDGEMQLHVSFCAGWGVSEPEMAATPEDPANMAYTRYVLERGLAGDALDLAVALAPCIVGYAETARYLMTSPDTVMEGNPYREWIETYAADDYQDVAWGHAAHLDRLLTMRGGPGRMPSLSKTFHDATRLEIGFWQMGLDGAAPA